MQGSELVRWEYHGLEVYRQVGLAGTTTRCEADEGVVLIESDVAGRVSGKIRFVPWTSPGRAGLCRERLDNLITVRSGLCPCLLI
jgi:hypothetical protein